MRYTIKHRTRSGYTYVQHTDDYRTAVDTAIALKHDTRKVVSAWVVDNTETNPRYTTVYIA